MEPRAERRRLGMPVLHRLRPREVEHFPRAGFRVPSVGETGEHAGAFVNEGQRFRIVQPLELGRGIACGLLLDRSDIVPPLLWLGLHNADGFLVDEENVVSRTDIGLILADGDSEAGTEVDFLL